VGVYLAGVLIAAPSPTPGNLGAIEAALILGLTVFGAPLGQAVATVLVYRLLTFWLPVLLGYLSIRQLEHQQVV
jgi:undecaprenyl-diphosphatase